MRGVGDAKTSALGDIGEAVNMKMKGVEEAKTSALEVLNQRTFQSTYSHA